MTSRALFVFMLCMSAPVLAREPESRPFDIVIVGGGKSEAEARTALDTLAARVTWVRVANRSSGVGVRKSDDFPGLTKGQYVAVLGLCPRGGKARPAPLLKAVQGHAPGAYVKHIQGRYDDSCPPLEAFQPPGAKEKPLLDRIQREPTSAKAYVAYGEFLKDQRRFDEAAAMASHAHDLDPDDPMPPVLLTLIEASRPD
ncbi:hypothetical protein LZ198_02410 [Myxococcus sp. K15C18031901]|uniref:hypothetical protein n=1 Tax=Myxococcus dinghuensis TaxID=2906761 RepID=UPI0020A71B8E|nr:hypothetical protein [Myxococcus dinghuensis]MCP3097725.1 hypothetical protein [Myxococcus dinghuensis]